MAITKIHFRHDFELDFLLHFESIAATVFKNRRSTQKLAYFTFISSSYTIQAMAQQVKQAVETVSATQSLVLVKNLIRISISSVSTTS
jgi:hypothetical protein